MYDILRTSPLASCFLFLIFCFLINAFRTIRSPSLILSSTPTVPILPVLLAIFGQWIVLGYCQNMARCEFEKKTMELVSLGPKEMLRATFKAAFSRLHHCCSAIWHKVKVYKSSRVSRLLRHARRARHAVRTPHARKLHAPGSCYFNPTLCVLRSKCSQITYCYRTVSLIWRTE